MHIKLEIADLEIYSHSDPSSQPGWVSGCVDGSEVRAKLADFTAWTPPSRQAVWHLFTGCGRGFGVVGVAYVGTLCRTSYNTGVDMLRNYRGRVVEDSWDTFAHELGHNFKAQHSFEDGQGSTGGIMDYGDGKLDGYYQFNTKYRKTEMCAEAADSVNACQGKFAETPDWTPPEPTPAPPPTPAPNCIAC